MNEPSIKTYVSALRWSAPIAARPNKGRWIVILYIRSTRAVIVGYRFCSKSEARRFARKRESGGVGVGAVVRRYRRRNWKRRTFDWTCAAAETTTWLWTKSAAAAHAVPEAP